MKRLVVIGLSAAALAACAHGPHIQRPHFHGPGKVHSPVVMNQTRYYEYGGRYYRRWREGWVAPVGYQPRDWQVGETLPKTYVDGSFDIKWNARNLPRPGDNRRWVRVGQDALLAEDNGRVDLAIRRFYQ